MELGLAVNDSGFSSNNEGSLVLENLMCWWLALAAGDSSLLLDLAGRGEWRLALSKSDRVGGLFPFARF